MEFRLTYQGLLLATQKDPVSGQADARAEYKTGVIFERCRQGGTDRSEETNSVGSPSHYGVEFSGGVFRGAGGL